jgi:hypothetical protein
MGVSSSAQIGKFSKKESDFDNLLKKFQTIKLPLNFKRYDIGPYNCKLSRTDAIKYLKMNESDLYYFERDETMDAPYTITKEKIDCVPCERFKYQLNNDIWIACYAHGKGEQDTAFIYLSSFSKEGKLIDKLPIGGFTPIQDSVHYEYNFIALDKSHFRQFVYCDYKMENKKKKIAEDKYKTISIYYTIDYEINTQGIFVQKQTSEKKQLLNYAAYYSIYRPDSDDPMNKY